MAIFLFSFFERLSTFEDIFRFWSESSSVIKIIVIYRCGCYSIAS
ncbi:hypothetical protein AZ041_003460, partial [Escherichia coli]